MEYGRERAPGMGPARVWCAGHAAAQTRPKGGTHGPLVLALVAARQACTEPHARQPVGPPEAWLHPLVRRSAPVAPPPPPHSSGTWPCPCVQGKSTTTRSTLRPSRRLRRRACALCSCRQRCLRTCCPSCVRSCPALHQPLAQVFTALLPVSHARALARPPHLHRGLLHSTMPRPVDAPSAPSSCIGQADCRRGYTFFPARPLSHSAEELARPVDTRVAVNSASDAPRPRRHPCHCRRPDRGAGRLQWWW